MRRGVGPLPVHVLFGSYIECDRKGMIALQVKGLGAADSPYVVREPDDRGRCEELRSVEYAGHLFRVVGERERREMWWRVWVRSRRALRRGQVVQSLRIYLKIRGQ